MKKRSLSTAGIVRKISVYFLSFSASSRVSAYWFKKFKRACSFAHVVIESIHMYIYVMRNEKHTRNLIEQKVVYISSYSNVGQFIMLR